MYFGTFSKYIYVSQMVITGATYHSSNGNQMKCYLHLWQCPVQLHSEIQTYSSGTSPSVQQDPNFLCCWNI